MVVAWCTLKGNQQVLRGNRGTANGMVILKSLIDAPMIITMLSRVFKTNACLARRLAVFGKFAFLFFMLKGLAWIAGAVLITWHYSQ